MKTLSTRLLAPVLGKILIMLGAAQAAPAHDFWIEPSEYRPRTATSVRLDLRVGESFRGKPVARRQNHIERFVILGPEGELPAAGIEARTPAGFARIDTSTTYVVGYQSRPSAIVLPPARFERYLEHEGLEVVSAERRRRGESETAGRELFSRCAKTLISAEGSASGFDARLGCALEIVPESDPAGLGASGFLPVRVLYHGRGIGGVQVAAISKASPDQPIVLRSDTDGLVEIPLAGDGPWLVKAVHMVRTPTDTTGADWESFWASLTFETGP
ncbi:MAG: DUF4198 domain-containing protein [Thermoanaerobaculia bacterium]